MPEDNMLPLSDVENFLNGYRALTRNDGNASAEWFPHRFDRLRDHLQAIKEQSIEQGLNTAPEFNVFRLLGLSRYEVRTHSAMLAHLLNPRAAHGQQFLFLQTFLEWCASKMSAFPLPQALNENDHWIVSTEYITPTDGRLDIVIRSPDQNYLLVIENKVDAWEQADQVKRYAHWLDSQRREYPDQALIYLTRTGRQAYSAQDASYLTLSYHADIPGWLEKLINQIQAFSVREVVKQYIDLARNL